MIEFPSLLSFFLCFLSFLSFSSFYFLFFLFLSFLFSFFFFFLFSFFIFLYSFSYWYLRGCLPFTKPSLKRSNFLCSLCSFSVYLLSFSLFFSFFFSFFFLFLWIGRNQKPSNIDVKETKLAPCQCSLTSLLAHWVAHFITCS